MCRCFQQRIALQQWTYEWRPAGEIVIYPRSFSMFGEPVVTSDVLGSPTRSETTECRRNGVKEVRRVIADSIRLLMNHLVLILDAENVNLEQSTKNIFDVIWMLASLPSYVSLYILWTLLLSLAYFTRSAPPTYCQDQPVNSNYDFWVS